MDNTLENVLANIVRIGKVSAVDTSKRKARVIFPDKNNMVSGWLHVIQRNNTALSLVVDGDPPHSHGGSVATFWMPKVNDTVLTIYLPVFNADGFILGAV